MPEAPTPQTTWLSWSSGKDSAHALSVLAADPSVRVTGLFTTITDAYGRVSMHGVREELLDAQAAMLGLPLHKVRIPAPCPNEEYEARMTALLREARAAGVEAMAFGDLFLQDIRDYREHMMAGTGLGVRFPLWGQGTAALAQEMLAAGIGAVLTCVDEAKLAPEFSGRAFDAALLADLPAGIDPCGENGEFHTFVHAHPLFRAPIAHTIGERVSREGFCFTDVLGA